MGIGVYESRDYVQRLGGDIEVLSRVGEGTTFRIRLPVSDVAKNDVKLQSARKQSRSDGSPYKEIAGY
jgi:signal transduction histidine kinase